MSTPVPQEEKFYTSKQVAEMFSVKTETVGDWIARGMLPGAFKIGTRWRIPKTAVLALANSKYGKEA